MLDRYSAEARKAVALAHDEAHRLGHPYIGTEHLLLGLLAEGDNAAARSLQRAGASLALCREKVAEALASRSGPRARSDLTGGPSELLEMTDRATRALDRAGRLSARLKSDEVQTSHMLVSVLDVEGTAGQVLRGLSVDLTAVRDGLAGQVTTAGRGVEVPALAEEAGLGRRRESATDASPTSLETDPLDATGAAVLAESPGQPAPPAFTDPVCATCGAPLASSLGHAVVSSTSGVDFDVAYCTTCGATFGATRKSRR